MIKAEGLCKVFVRNEASQGKKKLFESWGYSIIDSKYLQQEFIKQAKLAYSVGNYELGKLDKHGQRINIEIKLKRKDKDEYVTFRSGWMVYPNGRLVLTTPALSPETITSYSESSSTPTVI